MNMDLGEYKHVGLWFCRDANSPWVGGVIDLSKLNKIDLRINLRGGEIAVAQ